MDLRRYATSTVKAARVLTPRSFFRYAVWRSRGNPYDIRVRLRNGLLIDARGGTGDYWIVSEIFFHRQYEMPAEAPSRLETIVDTGANVGYACLWLLSECPQARITAFEPVPAHVAQIEAHLRLNGLRDRVELVPAAASVKDGTAHFEDKGPESGPAEDNGSAERIVVSLVDWYARLPEGPIELVKMDIEGGECDLLDDARFAELAARTRMIVLEWHEPTNGRGGRDWRAERLAQAGFSVSDGAQQYGVAGLLWGVRASVQAPNEFSTSS